MQKNSGVLLMYFLSVSATGLFVNAVEEFEPKPTKRPTKWFKSDPFHQKNPFSFSDTSEEDLENPFVPPPVPKNEQEANPWSWFLDPTAKGFVTPGEIPKDDKKDKENKDSKDNKDAEADATRTQRFIGPTAIDPFFYSNHPLGPPSLPSLPSIPRRPASFGYGLHNYELFMVVQPRVCSNGTEGNSTPPQDVGIKFLSNSDAPSPARCAFAIAACCAPFNYPVRYNCFEMLGCYNAFWDINPCAEDVVAAAVAELSNFYKAPENATTPAAPPSSEAPATPAAAPAAALES